MHPANFPTQIYLRDPSYEIRRSEARPHNRRFVALQRVRDWMYDFFSSLPKLCDDPSDAVAAAAFSAIGTLMEGHPLCTTLVDEEVRSFWGLEGRQQRRTASVDGKEGAGLGAGASNGLFGRHKQVRIRIGGGRPGF